MYKIGMIGERESIQGFVALGVTTFEVTTGEEAAKALATLVKSEEYAVIFVTEDLILALGEELDRYKDLPLPTITAIPGKGGTLGLGMTALSRATERAVGTDILFKEQGTKK